MSSNVMNRIRERLQNAEMDRELAYIEGLVEAADLVVSNWETGALARAVHDLEIALNDLGIQKRSAVAI